MKKHTPASRTVSPLLLSLLALGSAAHAQVTLSGTNGVAVKTPGGASITEFANTGAVKIPGLAPGGYVKSDASGVLSVDSGAAGPTGATGATGPTGDTGAQGIPGTPGAAGTPGAPGVQGPIGGVGPQGPQGATGPTGDTGAQGIQGVPGAAGAAGAQGAPGLQGPMGGVGPQGIQGVTGPTGATGPTGDTGAQGIPGTPGAAGTAGAQGAMGPQGPAGAQGGMGPQGPAGAQGDIGPQGPAGTQGIAGPTGATGAAGSGSTRIFGSSQSEINPVNGSTYYYIGTSGNTPDSSSSLANPPHAILSPVMTGTGTLRNLKVRTSVAPGNSRDWVFYVMKDGTQTSITCTIAGTSATTCSDGTNTDVSLTPTNLISLRAKPDNGNIGTAIITWSLSIE